MKRRTFLKISAGASAVAAPTELLGACAESGPAIADGKSGAPQASVPSGDVFVPGYWPDAAWSEGSPILDHPKFRRAVPKSYKGSIRLLTRLGMDGDIEQALFPVQGHNVEISPDGSIGFFGSMEQQSYVCFDPKSLDLIGLGKPFRKNWIGGGHGVFVADGSVLAVSERAPKVAYLGRPEKHFGRVTLREPGTLKVLDSFSTHGISPHDVRLLADGEHLAIANYGSTVAKRKKEYGVPRHIVEPSITILNINNGRLVSKYVSGSDRMELRHLCAHDFETIFAIQAQLGLANQDQHHRKGDKAAYEVDFTARESESYMPAPTLRADHRSGKLQPLGSQKMQGLMRQGLSIHYEPNHREVIATYPSTNSIMIYDATSGALKRRIDCSAIGLEYPSGLVLLKDPRYYVVAGYWKNLFVFERGTHRLMRELCHYTTFFGHSHITAS